MIVPTSHHVDVSPKLAMLTFLSYYLPGFKAGGPPRSVKNLARALDKDLHFSIATRDRDLGDAGPYPDIARDAWLNTEHGHVNYCSPTTQSLLSAARLMRDTPHDVLFLNSMFDVSFTMYPLLARRFGLAPVRPLVIAPRGEFAPGALALKPALKAAYIASAKALGLFDGVLWMASSEHERQDIERAVRVAPGRIVIASDLASAPSSEQSDPPGRRQGDPLRIVFLARISPMKNLDYAIDLLRDIEVPVAFDVYGPCTDPAYLEACRGRATDLPQHVCVTFGGELEPEQVHATLSCYDLILLPTRGESFGHVIFEAMQAGTPVLISNRTPWRTTGDGACVALCLEQPGQFQRIIKDRAMASVQEQAQFRRAARAHAARFRGDPGHASANRALFLRAAGRS